MPSKILRVNDGKIKITYSYFGDVKEFGIKPSEDPCFVLPVLITDTGYTQSDLTQKMIFISK